MKELTVREKIKKNNFKIKKINTALIAMLVCATVGVLGIILQETIVGVYFIALGWPGAALASCYCAVAAGRNFLNVGNPLKGTGCMGVILFPFVIIIRSGVYLLYSFTGWYIGLTEKTKLRTETRQLLAQQGKQSLEEIEDEVADGDGFIVQIKGIDDTIVRLYADRVEIDKTEAWSVGHLETVIPNDHSIRSIPLKGIKAVEFKEAEKKFAGIQLNGMIDLIVPGKNNGENKVLFMVSENISAKKMKDYIQAHIR